MKSESKPESNLNQTVTSEEEKESPVCHRNLSEYLIFQHQELLQKFESLEERLTGSCTQNTNLLRNQMYRLNAILKEDITNEGDKNAENIFKFKEQTKADYQELQNNIQE